MQSFTYKWNWLHNYVWVYTQKWTLGPLRIVLFIIWFWALFAITHRYQKAISRYSQGVLELLGRNSLFVYIAHAFIVFAFRLYLIQPGTSLAENFVITATALALLIGLTMLYQRQMSHRKAINPVPNDKKSRIYLRPAQPDRKGAGS
jgi:fucose 4-O-acetylase-like acetyltransferase